MGIALLKLASNSTSSVIKWEIILISIDAKIIITQILIKGSAPVANIVGTPAYNNKLDNLLSHSVLEIIFCLLISGG